MSAARPNTISPKDQKICENIIENKLSDHRPVIHADVITINMLVPCKQYATMMNNGFGIADETEEHFWQRQINLTKELGILAANRSNIICFQEAIFAVDQPKQLQKVTPAKLHEAVHATLHTVLRAHGDNRTLHFYRSGRPEYGTQQVMAIADRYIGTPVTLAQVLVGVSEAEKKDICPQHGKVQLILLAEKNNPTVVVRAIANIHLDWKYGKIPLLTKLLELGFEIYGDTNACNPSLAETGRAVLVSQLAEHIRSQGGSSCSLACDCNGLNRVFYDIDVALISRHAIAPVLRTITLKTPVPIFPSTPSLPKPKIEDQQAVLKTVREPILTSLMVAIKQIVDLQATVN